MTTEEEATRPPAWYHRELKVDMWTPGWHGVLPTLDDTASDMATVDLACMLAVFLAPKVIVEAGTYKGHMVTALAQTLSYVRHPATIYTADPEDHGVKELVAGSEVWSRYIRYSQTDYLDMLATVDEPIDLAFIDASSLTDPHMRLKHTEATMWKMRPGGLLLVDDTAALDWADAKVIRGMSQIFLAPHRGLAILQKPYDKDSPYGG
jgi:predicted O-methyltransferase YrrM